MHHIIIAHNITCFFEQRGDMYWIHANTTMTGLIGPGTAAVNAPQTARPVKQVASPH